jgi:predicted TIM-barrel fold metal-dependent hydrolase
MTCEKPDRGSTVTDWHAHWLPPSFLDHVQRRRTPPLLTLDDGSKQLLGANGARHKIGEGLVDIEDRLRSLDRLGIDRQVLSLPGLFGVDTATSEDPQSLVSTFNEGLSRLVEQRGDRFDGLASLPLARLDDAPAALERALTELGLVGAILPADGFVDKATARLFEDVFRVADKARAHIFIHPGPLPSVVPPQIAHPDEATALRKGVLDIQNGLTAAALTFEFTDFLDAYPAVTVHLANLGGNLAFLTERIEHGAARYNLTERHVDGSLKRIYVDTASFGPRAIEFATNTFGEDRVLFGSDAPFFPPADPRPSG